MKKILAIAAICSVCICTSCDSLTDSSDMNNTENTEDGTNDNTTSNPVAGTTWVWSEDPITWTFTFTENEVTFDYRAEFSPSDISTSQYKSTYTYTSSVIKFDMKVWSDIEWKCGGTISGDTMHLASTGTENWEIDLKKK